MFKKQIRQLFLSSLEPATADSPAKIKMIEKLKVN
jgi:hypothetical protein